MAAPWEKFCDHQPLSAADIKRMTAGEEIVITKKYQVPELVLEPVFSTKKDRRMLLEASASHSTVQSPRLTPFTGHDQAQ